MDMREAEETDLEAMWGVYTAVASSSEPLPFNAELDRDQFYTQWYGPSLISGVAEEGPHLLGIYKLSAMPGETNVATGCYLVRPEVQNKGVGRALVQHSIARAQDADFEEIQVQFVPSTQKNFLVLLEELSFEVIKTLPGAYRHPEQGLVDAYVFQRFLQ